MQFKRLSIIEIIATVVFASISIGLALGGYGVWNIIWGLFVSNIMSNMLYLVLSPWKPTIKFDKKSFQELFYFGINILGTNLIGELSINLDLMIVGKLLGSSSLGIYSLSYRTATFIPKQLNSILIKVLFPAFSEIQDKSSEA